MNMYKILASDEKSKKVCDKSIKNCKKALKIVPNIKHIEILYSVYNTIVAGKENIFALSGTIISSKQLKKWDTTKEGFKEFQEREEEARNKQKLQNEELERNRMVMEEARKTGKKVEIVYENGVAKPVMVEEEKPNA